MAKADKNSPQPDPGDGRKPEQPASSSDGVEEGSTDQAAGRGSVPGPSGTDGLIEAEGPDVETSLSDSDLSFLSGQSSADDLAAERLADLQRVTAEYANYRKRTADNREMDRERAVGDTVQALLPVLDDIDLAEKHGDLAAGGAFATIAAKLRSSVERLGLKPFGEAGEPFDHNLHEAIFQQPNPDVEVETIADVVQTGYYLGSTMLRAAKVVVSVPEGLNG